MLFQQLKVKELIPKFFLMFVHLFIHLFQMFWSLEFYLTFLQKLFLLVLQLELFVDINKSNNPKEFVPIYPMLIQDLLKFHYLICKLIHELLTFARWPKLFVHMESLQCHKLELWHLTHITSFHFIHLTCLINDGNQFLYFWYEKAILPKVQSHAFGMRLWCHHNHSDLLQWCPKLSIPQRHIG